MAWLSEVPRAPTCVRQGQNIPGQWEHWGLGHSCSQGANRAAGRRSCKCLSRQMAIQSTIICHCHLPCPGGCWVPAPRQQQGNMSSPTSATSLSAPAADKRGAAATPQAVNCFDWHTPLPLPLPPHKEAPQGNGQSRRRQLLWPPELWSPLRSPAVLVTLSPAFLGLSCAISLDEGLCLVWVFYSAVYLSTHMLYSREAKKQIEQLSGTKAKHHVKSTI